MILATLDDADTPLLLEEAVPIRREIYLALRIDCREQRLELLVGPEGGEDIEQTARLARIPAIDGMTTAETIYPETAKLFPSELAVHLARYAARLPDIARQEDLELLEINPLALTEDDRLVVCDAKLVRDDSAAFRHDADEFPTSRRLGERTITPLERSARELGFQLVETQGDIVLVTSGAGLAMMM
ncbi:MAG TPA: ATP-grasp domain-containing protein, partial [Xanthobacteraceae bacterium]